MLACAQLSVNAGQFSLARFGSHLTHDVAPGCGPSLPQLLKTVHCSVGNALDVYELSLVYKSHEGGGKTSGSRNSTKC